MARLMLVANPAASQFTGGDHRAILRTLRTRHLVEAVWPQSAADARVIAADAVTAGFDGVIAMGGDGIVHQIAQSLVGTDVYLAVFPAGTTNVFARRLGLPPKARRAARLLAGDVAVSPWPVVTFEGVTDDGEAVGRHAVFAAGIGLDADVVAAAETEPYRKYRFGAVHYARTALGLLWSDLRKRQPGIRVERTDSTPAPSVLGIGVMVQFHPAFTYFGRWPLRFAPDVAKGMTVAVVERLPLRRVPSLLWRAARGTLATMKGLHVLTEVGEFEVKAGPPARVELDGEVIGRFTTGRVTFRPDALWVVSPAGVNGPSAADPALPTPD